MVKGKTFTEQICVINIILNANYIQELHVIQKFQAFIIRSPPLAMYTSQ